MPANERPNFLLITSDQQHWNTLGCLNPALRTPNLNRLARDGTLFTRAYTSNPTCTPARASMITGRYPSQHGAWSLGTKLPETERTVGEELQRAGYRTALVGKAHFQQNVQSAEYPSLEARPLLQDLDFWRTFRGPFYGFEHVELARNHGDEFLVGQHYALWMEENGLGNWRDFFRPPTGNNPNQRLTWGIPERYHYDAWIAERSQALMQGFREREEPFFLWASFFDPHPPYLAPEPWDKMYDPDEIEVPQASEGEHGRLPPHFRMTQEEKPDFSAYKEPDGHTMHGFSSHLVDPAAQARNIAVYYGMISLMDKYIGAILDEVDRQGLADNTVVLFTTDHGHLFGQHGLVKKGAFHYDDLLRVPFLVRWPGQVPAGRRSAALQSFVDLAPTFLGLAGAPVPRTMVGRDQGPVWRGKAQAVRDHVLVENHHQPTTIHVKTYVDARYKITVYCNHAYGELFDLQEDPGETRNLWDEPAYAECKSELLLKFLHAELEKEPVWMPRVGPA